MGDRKKQHRNRKQKRKQQHLKNLTSGRELLVLTLRARLKMMLKKRAKGFLSSLWSTLRLFIKFICAL